MRFPPVQPSWISEYIPPSRANVVTDFDLGTYSRLRLTNVRSNASFTATWSVIEPLKYRTIIDFWNQVENVDSFELPQSFFNCNMPAAIRELIRSSSPTSMWRISETPSSSEDNFELRTVTISFVSEIDP